MCKQEINNFSIGGGNHIISISGNCNLADNEVADELYRECSSLSAINFENEKTFEALKGFLRGKMGRGG